MIPGKGLKNKKLYLVSKKQVVKCIYDGIYFLFVRMAGIILIH